MVIKSAIILPDVHGTTYSPRDYLPVRDFIKGFKPDEIILLGDFMDVESLSAWDMDKKRKMEGRRFNKEIEWANKELDYLQKHSKKVTYLEGNHEDRVNRYLDKNPEMEGMIELKEQLKIKDRGIEWVPMNDLYKKGNMYFTHGLYTNIHNARKHLQSLGCNVCYGHQHGTQTAMQNMKMQEPHMAYALGTLGNKAPDFMKNRPSNWLNQFGVFYWDDKTGAFSLYPVNVINHKFMWNKKIYGERAKPKK